MGRDLSRAPVRIRRQLGDIRGKAILGFGLRAGGEGGRGWFAKQGANSVASDLSSEFLALVQPRGHLAWHAGANPSRRCRSCLDFPDNNFDVVYAGNVLHHVDTDKTLDQIYRILKPGGVVVTWDLPHAQPGDQHLPPHGHAESAPGR